MVMSEMRIILRSEWGAEQPDDRHVIATPTRELWLHHFATDGWHGPSGMRKCQDFHMNTQGWDDIGYSFCVDNNDGTIYEARGAAIAGAHTSGHNSISHAIAIMANLEVTPMSRAAIESCARLAEHGFRQGWWPDTWTGGHKEASGAQTKCPGRYGMAALPDIRSLTAQYIRQGTTTPTPPSQEDDDMARNDLIIMHPIGAAVYVHESGTLVGIKTADDLTQFANQGVPVIEVTDRTWQEFHAKFNKGA